MSDYRIVCLSDEVDIDLLRSALEGIYEIVGDGHDYAMVPSDQQRYCIECGREISQNSPRAICTPCNARLTREARE